MKSRDKALLVAKLAKDKKAEDIVILDLRKRSNIADFFVIATAGSTKRAQTIKEAIEKGLYKAKEPLFSVEGKIESGWIVADAYEVVAHIFNADTRKYYDIEGLWKGTRRIRLCQKKKKTPSKKISKRK